MVDYEYAQLFEEDNVIKQWVIDYGSGKIRNEDLDSQSIELMENLCSEPELRFGCCESSCFKFKCANISKSLTGSWITVSIILNNHDEIPFFVGKYKVESDKLTADRMHREVIAYDAMHDIIKSDVSDWYNFIFRDEGSKISIRSLRIALSIKFGLFFKEQTLANDNILIKKTINPEKLSGLDILSAICEINGCFCRISRNGRLEFVYLSQDTLGLYPSETLYPGNAPDYLPQSETGSLYPQEPDSFEIKRSCCISCQYEDYFVKPITKLQIRQEEEDAGAIFPDENISEDDNCYIIEDNFLVYGKNNEELREIAENIFPKINNIVYRPFSADVRGNLCLETGDAIRISTKYDILESYILNRNIKGGWALRDNISSQGTEKYSATVNSISKSIAQLDRKTNILKRTVDETVSEIYSYGEDGEKYSKIEQNTEQINFKVSKGEVSSEISLESGKVSLKGNRLEVESENFKLDEDGNVDILGSITARSGISLTWVDFLKLPPIEHPYSFVETQYNSHEGEGGIFYGEEPYLIVKSPRGSEIIVIGSANSSQNPDKFKMKDTPYFPNGAMIEDAYISSLLQTFINPSENITNGSEWVQLRIRISGAFVCVYGTYNAYSQEAWKTKEITIGGENDLYIPTYANVRTVAYSGKNTFIFTITTDGRFLARNESENNLNSASGAISIGFRFDFFRF